VLWIGVVSGLFTFKDGKFKREEILPWHTFIWSIHQTADGSMWFGTARGLARYAAGRVDVFTTANGLAGDDVKIIREDEDGGLWVGTYGGLSHFKDGKFTSYSQENGLPSDRVRSLYLDGEGTLWIGTYDGGLARLKDGRFTQYNTRNGLFDEGVFQILEDGRGNFWMSCNRGIYRTSKQQLDDPAAGKTQRISCISYGVQDGMLNAECNGGRQPAGIKARDGKLWISAQGPLSVTADGTVSFMPVAVVSDSAVGPGILSVQATGVPPGLTVAGLKNTNGVITAYVGAACHETPGMYSATLQVSDGANNPVATTVVINVGAPQAGGPPLSYPAQVKVAPGQSATIKPSVPLPAGAAVSRVRVFNNGIGGYDGTATVDQAGNVTLTGVGPSGSSFTVIVTSVMGCSVAQDSAFLVVTPTYDKCLKDDSSGNFIRFNSRAGDYLLTVCGAGGFSFSGTGTIRVSGSVLMVTDTQVDRRVTISYLTNQLTGNATINIAVAPGVFNTLRITQRNINAACACS
jgi:ligand-binding sensor domain-containing protein